jgi:signal transduction histidine kinase
MERPDAGLTLVKRIRQELDNPNIRIILRTGQPGEAPEREVMVDYDINDYKSKTELTAQKLFTALVGALRSWRDILRTAQMAHELAEINANLETKVEERTRDLDSAKTAAEQALERESAAKQDLRQFLSMMSHEFRTPLAIIDSAAQMLMLRTPEPPEAAKPRLEAIRGGVTRLVGLIETCLADDRLEAETLSLKADTLNLAPLLQVAVEQQQAAHPQRKIVLAQRRLPDIMADSGLLVLALNNLLTNALKYSGDDDEVRVDAASDGQWVTIGVTDRGIGIPANQLDHIFQRFYRADNVRGVAGTGIGLHMTQRIVTLHGGAIEVQSAEGKGSTFTMRLPVPQRAKSQ